MEIQKMQKYPVIHRMEQRSEAWNEIRKGRLTASNAHIIATNGKGLNTYVYEILAEKYALNSEEPYTSLDMARGIELEDQARMAYEIEYQEVEQVGFIEMDEHTGASPDGLIEKDGGIEIKCVNNKNFFRLMVDGEEAIEPKYWWQCQMLMLVGGRKFWKLVFYNKNFSPNILIFTFTPDIMAQEKLIIGIENGKKLIREIEERLCKK